MAAEKHGHRRRFLNRSCRARHLMLANLKNAALLISERAISRSMPVVAAKKLSWSILVIGQSRLALTIILPNAIGLWPSIATRRLECISTFRAVLRFGLSPVRVARCR